MLCPHCGSENSDSAKFCTFCGAPLQNPQEQTTPNVANPNVGAAGTQPANPQPSPEGAQPGAQQAQQPNDQSGTQQAQPTGQAQQPYGQPSAQQAQQPYGQPSAQQAQQDYSQPGAQQAYGQTTQPVPYVYPNGTAVDDGLPKRPENIPAPELLVPRAFGPKQKSHAVLISTLSLVGAFVFVLITMSVMLSTAINQGTVVGGSSGVGTTTPISSSPVTETPGNSGSGIDNTTSTSTALPESDTRTAQGTYYGMNRYQNSSGDTTAPDDYYSYLFVLYDDGTGEVGITYSEGTPTSQAELDQIDLYDSIVWSEKDGVIYMMNASDDEYGFLYDGITEFQLGGESGSRTLTPTDEYSYPGVVLCENYDDALATVANVENV